MAVRFEDISDDTEAEIVIGNRNYEGNRGACFMFTKGIGWN